MKKTISSAIIVLLLYLVLGWIYEHTLSSANKKWHQERYVNQEIRGPPKSINGYPQNSNLTVLVIKNAIDQKELTYGTICLDTTYKNYISVGDSVHKNRGTEKISFCKGTGDCKQFELDFCK